MRYLLGVVAVVVVTVVAILLIITHDSGPSTSSGTTPAKTVKLDDYTSQNATVSYLVEGRLVGDESRRAIRISVSKDNRVVQELNGYDQRVVRSATYDNTDAGYEQFLKALNVAGFGKQRVSSLKSEDGICPLGRTFVVSLDDEKGDEKLRSWATSCATSQGTFAGSLNLVQQLFQNQIPDYQKFSSQISL